MDVFDSRTRIIIINKPLYEFLCDYSRTRLIKDGIRIKNIDSLIEKNNYKLTFEYKYSNDDVECQPESFYDITTCLLIFLGITMDWSVDRFLDFKAAYIKKVGYFNKHYEEVTWETERWSRRPDDDGTFETKEVFYYDVKTDQVRFTRTLLKVPYKGSIKYDKYDWNDFLMRIDELHS